MFLAIFAVILWVIANRFNVSTNGDHDWECATAITIIVSITTLIFGNSNWTYCLLLAFLLFPTNWLYFKITGHTDSILSFVLFVPLGVIGCLLLPSLGASWILEMF
ncbi:MAG: hypothetical protein ABSA06_09260 [Geobacteraceae bacterium]|jgi:hypothetical protein